ncbi:thiamine diphosphokinase [Marimonas arenosa]|uniref:thiamine diphosphokinase n=1 Tax=Marimonas arenosa TaxID=1795305 RepID=UPI0035E3CB99
MKKALLKAAIVHGSKIVAADGAARVVLENGFVPEAVIGDFDSISEATRAVVPEERCHVFDDQDTTDFEKCLSLIEAPLIIGVGFLGGRVDHQLAVLHGLIRFAARPCLLLGKRDLVFLCPPDLRLDLPVGSRFSLFPMTDIRARSDGLRWALDGISFAPGERIGTSNEVCGPVRVEVDRPGMIVILPAGRFATVVRALADPQAPRWTFQ